MDALAKALLNQRVSLAVVVFCLLLSGALAVLAVQVEQDDDLLAFLPQSNPDVRLFSEINQRFGGLDVAIVAIDAPDLWTPDFLTSLAAVTAAADDIEEVAYAVSIINVDDITPDEMGGIRWSSLIDRLPSNDLEAEFVRDRVMSRDHIVGRMVSADGDAVIVYCFLGAESDPRVTAERIRDVVLDEFADHEIFWGGAPFISTWIYDTAKDDMDRLTPWSVALIIFILLVTFRDVRGAVLALLTTGMGIGVSLGTMQLLGLRYNIVLSSMPVILFAVGSAYAIHVLAHYYRHAESGDPAEALRLTLAGVGPPVLAAGLTTVAGLLSFMAMDIEPMRVFGQFTALGIFSTLVFSLTFVPAVIRVTGMKAKPPGVNMAAPTVALARFSAERRLAVVTVLLAGVVAATFFVSRVQTRMDNAAFFDSGSEPDLSERFLLEHFGGSQYLQVLVRGDLRDPVVLRDVQRTVDEMSLVRGVSATIDITGPLSQANEAMEGIRRIPDSSQKIGLLFGLMTGNKAVEQLIDGDRTEALIQLQLGATRAEELSRILSDVERYLEQRDLGRRPVQMAEVHIEAPCRRHDVAVDRGKLGEAIRGPLGEGDLSEVVAQMLVVFMGTDEFLVDLPDEPGVTEAFARALAAAGPAPDADAILSAATTSMGLESIDDAPFLPDDLVFSIETPAAEAWSQAAGLAKARDLVSNAGLTLPEGDEGERLMRYIAGSLTGLHREASMRPPEVEYVVSGLPVLYRGLEQSVTANQFKSLGLALALVFVILSVVFRSPLTGLLASCPTFLTLLAVYGAMGALGVHLDIGTSMLASLIIGAGVDYAVHMVAAWRAPEGAPRSAGAVAAARTTAVAVWTNAIMVAAGFWVLTLGDARPLKNVGMLTASAMLVAGLTTFIAIPALARKRSYSGAATLAALDHGEET